jgi:hypothetical protein
VRQPDASGTIVRNFTKVVFGAFLLGIVCTAAASADPRPVTRVRGDKPATPSTRDGNEASDAPNWRSAIVRQRGARSIHMGEHLRKRGSGSQRAQMKPDLAFTAPMRVVLVHSAETGCEPHCAAWIAAQGKIEASSVDRFRQVLDRLGPRNVPVLIHSPGGRVDAAMTIGRMIRKRQMDIAVSRTKLEPCLAADRHCLTNLAASGVLDSAMAGCESACPIILAGGRHRIVSPWAQVGVHQVKAFETFTKVYRVYRVSKVGATITHRSLISERTSEKIVALKSPPAKITDQLSQYFKEMGIGDALMATMESTPNTILHILSQAELEATRLATDFTGPEHLLARAVEAQATADPLEERNSEHAGDELLLKSIPLDGSIPQRAALVVATRNDKTHSMPYLGNVTWRLIELRGSDGEPVGTDVIANIDIPGAKITAFIVLENRRRSDNGSMDVRIAQAANIVAPLRDVGTPRLRNDEAPLGIPIPSIRTKNGELSFHFDFLPDGPQGRQIVNLIHQATWFDLPLLIDGNIPAKITWEKGIPGSKATLLAYPSVP